MHVLRQTKKMNLSLSKLFILPSNRFIFFCSDNWFWIIYRARVGQKKKWLLIKMKQFCDPGKMKHPNCQFHLKHTSRTNIASLRFSTGNSKFNSSVKMNSAKENTTYSLNPCGTHLWWRLLFLHWTDTILSTCWRYTVHRTWNWGRIFHSFAMFHLKSFPWHIIIARQCR